MKKISLMALMLSFSAMPVQADTLETALAKAYENNPALKSARASTQAIDENVAIAKSGFRPTLTIDGAYADTKINSNARINGVGQKSVDGYNRVLSATLAQPIFNGFKTINSVNSAKNYVRAAHAGLKETEQNVLLNASIAYLDVLRDEAIVKLQKNNEKLLKKELDETQERFKVGEVTTTDVSQAKASYASAQSQRISAEGNLEASKAIYEQVIGTAPKNIKDPKNIENLFPKSMQEALDYAKDNNYSVSAAKHTLKARKYDVNANKGDLLPSINAYASAGRLKNENYMYDKNPTNDSVEFGVNFSAEKKTLLIIGGSLGAASVNKAIRSALPKLLEDFQVIHLCGKEKIDNLRTQFPVTQLHFVATDGYANHMRETLAQMDDAAYAIYLRYHFATCERGDLVGYSNHTLDIFRKD